MVSIKAVYDYIYACIKKNLPEPSFQQIALQALEFNASEGFVFSKLTNVHYEIWKNEDAVEKDLFKLMASVELTILAADILDDLQDKDNNTAPWMEWNYSIALNLVPLLLNLSKIAILDTSLPIDKKVMLVNHLLEYEILGLRGQYLDITKKNLLSEEEYLHIVEKKSGALIALACLLGASNASNEEQNSIKQYALSVGCVAQLENDLLGIEEQQSYKDILQRDVTLPTIYLLSHNNQAFLPLKDYYDYKIDEITLISYLKRNKELLKKSGVFEYSKYIQYKYVQKALLNIDKLPIIEENRIKLKNSLLKR